MSTIREDFEAHWTSEHERAPLTWAMLFGSSLQHKGQMPEDLEGVYFSNDAQLAWIAYQAATERAAVLCEKQAGELSKLWRACHKTNAHLEGQSDGAFDCAAAIRAQTGGEHD